MPDDFDPYHKWLGIPPSEQPPNHYRLLGIPIFESDREVIRNAVDQHMSYLKAQSGGPHADFSQRLLNEVSAAKVCLLTAHKKQPYDAQLQRVRETEEAGKKPVDRRFDTEAVLRPNESGRRDSGRSSRDRNLAVVSIFLAFLCVVIVVLVFLTYKYRQDIREISGEVSALQTHNELKDAEIRRLSNQLRRFEPGELDMNYGRETGKEGEYGRPAHARNFALEFSGRPGFVETPILFDGKHAITMEAWVSPADLRMGGQVWQTIVGDVQGGGVSLALDDRESDSKVVWIFQVFDRRQGKYIKADSTRPVVLGPPMVHIAGVWDKKEVRLYVDGEKQIAVPFEGEFGASSRPMLIGCDPSPTRNQGFFHGLIDEVRISETVRYKEDFAPQRRLETDTDTLALFHFDEGSGEVCFDSSDRNNNAKNVQSPLWIAPRR